MDSDSSAPDSSMGFLLLFQVVLIVLNAVFASAEIAVLSINDAKLARLVSQGNKKAKRGVGISRSTLDTIAVIFIMLILSYFTLIFGELVPKRVAMKKSEQLALGISVLFADIELEIPPVHIHVSLIGEHQIAEASIRLRKEPARESQE